MYSQSDDVCAFGSLQQLFNSEYPNYQNGIDQYELDLVNNPGKKIAQDDLYEIPVVVHIIHDNGPENISDQQILSALDQTNSQLAGLEGGIDTKVRLSLAKIDPEGNCTNGIVRVQSNSPYVAIDDALSFSALANTSEWPGDKYLNIWIIKCIQFNGDCPVEGQPGPTFTGFGTPPTQVFPNIDGIGIVHNYFGTTGTATGNDFNTLTHELGHYLSLLHVWGDDFGPCEENCHKEDDCNSKGDKVCDTEPCRYPVLSPTCESIGSLCEDCPNYDPNHIYPLDNYMSYSATCQNKFTQGQAERMYFALNEYRSGLWSEENRNCTGVNNTVDHLLIDEHTIWTTSNLPNGGDVNIFGDLIIESGASLEIEQGVVLRFCSDAALVIKPNAELSLSGTLTNSCGKPWKGIEVWGDNSQSQYKLGGDYAQGRFIGNPGAVVKNAITGAQLWGPTKSSYAGGQIRCNGVLFQNNQIAVEFAPYTNFWPYPYPAGMQGQERDYVGHFSRCSFLTDNDYSQDAPFFAYLKMDRVDGVTVRGCKFINEQVLTEPDQIVDYGYGIFATDAGFRVYADCIDIDGIYPCDGFENSFFSGLGYGIFSVDLVTVVGGRPYLVKQSDFQNCYIGIYNNSISGATMLFNNFQMGNVPDASIMGDQFGVFLENSIPGFDLEENSFTGEPGNVSTTIGSFFKELGTFDNKVRRNNYLNLDIGNLANGENGSLISGENTGLHFLCNYNEGSNDYDIAATNEGQGLNVIRTQQGKLGPIFDGDPVYISAGNRFSYTSVDFLNEANDVYYHYFAGAPNQEPILAPGVFKVVASDNNTCPSDYCEPPCGVVINEKRQDYFESREKANTALAAMQAALTAGDNLQADLQEQISSWHQQQMDWAAYRIIQQHLFDTLLDEPDTLEIWQERLHDFGTNLERALLKQVSGNSSSAQVILQQLSSSGEMTHQQTEELTNFQTLIDLFLNESPFELDSGQLDALWGLASNEVGYTGHFARNLLTWYGYSFPPQYFLPQPDEVVIPNGSDLSTQPSKSNVLIFPNPSSGQFTVHWQSSKQKMQRGTLTISDVSGREVRKVAIQPNQRLQFSLEHLPQGMYRYQLQSNGAIVDSGKIIVSP